jgi:hypothetical protein
MDAGASSPDTPLERESGRARLASRAGSPLGRASVVVPGSGLQIANVVVPGLASAGLRSLSLYGCRTAHAPRSLNKPR